MQREFVSSVINNVSTIVLRVVSAVFFCFVFFVLYSYQNLAYRSGVLTDIFFTLMLLILLVAFVYLLLFRGGVNHSRFFVLAASIALVLPETAYLLLSMGGEDKFRLYSLEYLAVLILISFVCVQVIRLPSLFTIKNN